VTATAAEAALTAEVDREARRALVEGHPTLEGIDFVEVLANRADAPGHVPGAPAQRTLLVHLLNRDVPADWDAGRVVVLGGVRADPLVNPVRVSWAWPAVAVAGGPGTPPVDPLPGVTAADRTLVAADLPEVARGRVLVVRTSSSGDWSTYVLRLLDEGGQGVPAGFDVPLAQAPFAFTVDCPSPLDCRVPLVCPPGEAGSPVQDYLARDYEALRIRLLDRLSALLPGWTDRSPADPGVMLVELFAYLGDRLAYWQDAVAEEAYLASARRRTSLRRHARLLDYAVHDGCAARTWLALSAAGTFTLDAGAPVADLDAEGGRPVDAVSAGGVVFETRALLRVRPARNQVPLHAWGDPDHCLPTAATAAFLGAPAADGDPELRRGDVLVLADLPAGGMVADGDPARRFAVRLDREPVRHDDPLAPGVTVLEVHWHADDALPAPLQVTSPGPDGRPQVRAVALANVVLADHGASVAGEQLDPPQVPERGPYRPRLERAGLAWADPGDAASATAALRPDPRRAEAAVELDDGRRTWQPRRDLLASGRLAAHFVVEPEADGVARLRFGDGVTGRRPSGGSVPLAWYRLGGGRHGNVAAGRLDRLLLRPDGSPPAAGVTVWNPLPAAGGTDPEPLEAVRQLAPHAFRRQLRAVVSPDYAAVASGVGGVQRAVARRRWTGSWYAQEVTVDPVAARAEDPEVPAAVGTELEVRRMAGVDVELARPAYVPLEIALTGCVEPGYLAAEVQRQLQELLSARVRADGRRGFFHPDSFTFGQPLFVSDLVAAAMSVAGLAWVEVTGFARRGGSAADTAAALAAGQLEMAAREVLRCDSDPSNPEAGHVEIDLGGGS
jgi:hypothetical protein